MPASGLTKLRSSFCRRDRSFVSFWSSSRYAAIFPPFLRFFTRRLAAAGVIEGQC